MWGPGPWAAPVWGFWWIFPLIGFLVCLGHRAVNDHVAEMGREIQALREEIEQLKASR